MSTPGDGTAADLRPFLDVLERTPGVLALLLGGQDDAWWHQREGEGRWTPFEVLGHLLVGEETDWIPRTRIVLEHGEGRAFEPFDRAAHLGAFDDVPADDLLVRFAAAREANLAALVDLGLTDAQLSLRGLHPELGPVTLGNLLAAWSVHDLAHTAQVCRALASRHKAAVGPWVEYMGILGGTK